MAAKTGWGGRRERLSKRDGNLSCQKQSGCLRRPPACQILQALRCLSQLQNMLRSAVASALPAVNTSQSGINSVNVSNCSGRKSQACVFFPSLRSCGCHDGATANADGETANASKVLTAPTYHGAPKKLLCSLEKERL